MKIRIGTRDSQLATWQAKWVAAELQSREIDTELVFMKTLGDVKSGPIEAVGTQGVFTKEIQRALLDGQIDLAVHSLKDLPTDAIDRLTLAAVPPRQRCGDALIATSAGSIDKLPQKARVATGSARRRSQLLAFRADLDICDLRGNVDTRLRKLREGNFDAIVLAEAGLHRLGLQAHISQVIPKEVMLPAVGQGALGLETRLDDDQTRAAVTQLNDETTYAAVTAERSLLRRLRGGCLAPVGAWCRPGESGDALLLDAVVLSPTGDERLFVRLDGSINFADDLGQAAANELITRGAERILQEARS